MTEGSQTRTNNQSNEIKLTTKNMLPGMVQNLEMNKQMSYTNS
jgi:hypothetical protein